MTTLSAAERLAQPIKYPISGRVASNRFLKASMSEDLSTWSENDDESGIPTPEYINLYKAWGEGGWGQILSGNVMINPRHLENAKNSIVPKGAPFSGPRFEAFEKTAKAAKAHGSLLVAQVSHPGRQCNIKNQPNPISASDIQLVASFGKYAKPRPATQEDIDDIIESFAYTAEYLEKAGWDGVQLHGAHGYLLAQFMSPTTNKRTDQYGGSVSNRVRLIIQVANAVRARTSPSFIVGIKLNSVEFQEGGITEQDAKDLCAALDTVGFDYFELSGGTYEKFAFQHMRDSTKKREAFFLDFAETIMSARHGAETDPKVYITGGFKTAKGMAGALDVVDGVGMATASANDPAVARNIISGKVDGVPASTVPDDNFSPAAIAAKAQMALMGEGKPLIDMTEAKNWMALMPPMPVETPA